MKRMRYWIDQECLNDMKSDYYIKTTEEYNDLFKKIKKDQHWFENFIKIVQHYYKNNGAGGNLHVVLDDGNLEDINIGWCAGLCLGRQDHEGMDIANLMRNMTMAQRQRVYDNYDLF